MPEPTVVAVMVPVVTLMMVPAARPPAEPVAASVSAAAAGLGQLRLRGQRQCDDQRDPEQLHEVSGQRIAMTPP